MVGEIECRNEGEREKHVEVDAANRVKVLLDRGIVDTGREKINIAIADLYQS